MWKKSWSIALYCCFENKKFYFNVIISFCKDTDYSTLMSQITVTSSITVLGAWWLTIRKKLAHRLKSSKHLGEVIKYTFKFGDLYLNKSCKVCYKILGTNYEKLVQIYINWHYVTQCTPCQSLTPFFPNRMCHLAGCFVNHETVLTRRFLKGD